MFESHIQLIFYTTHILYSNLMAFMFYSPQGAIFSDSLMI